MEFKMSETFEKLNNTVDTRFKNKKRDYTVQDVKKLSGSVKIDHTTHTIHGHRLISTKIQKSNTEY